MQHHLRAAIHAHSGTGRALFQQLPPADQLAAVRAMAADGHSPRQIAEATGLALRAVERVLAADQEAA